MEKFDQQELMLALIEGACEAAIQDGDYCTVVEGARPYVRYSRNCLGGSYISAFNFWSALKGQYLIIQPVLRYPDTNKGWEHGPDMKFNLSDPGSFETIVDCIRRIFSKIQTDRIQSWPWIDRKPKKRVMVRREEKNGKTSRVAPRHS